MCVSSLNLNGDYLALKKNNKNEGATKPIFAIGTAPPPNFHQHPSNNTFTFTLFVDVSEEER
jgi:hypothetical protein